MTQTVVSPNPIADPIRSSGLALEIVDEFTVPASSSNRALTRVNFTYPCG